MTKGWLFYLGYWLTISIALFIFVGIPLIAYLGVSRKLKLLPSMESLLTMFPDGLQSLDKPPYNKLDASTGYSVLYLELLISYISVKAIRKFKGVG